MALTKNDIVESLRADLGFPKSKSLGITECLIDQIEASVESGEDVLVAGFGKFCVKDGISARGETRRLVKT